MVVTIADVVERLLSGAYVLTNLLQIACIAVAVIFIVMAVVNYRMHYINPKLVPLDRPITYLILGIIAIIVAIAYKIAETGHPSAVKQTMLHKEEQYGQKITDIDAPLE